LSFIIHHSSFFVMRIRLDSVGCRLNIGEIEAAARHLSGLGHRVVTDGDEADLIVLNTCAVTGDAARKSRHSIRRLRRLHPEARVVVTGCFAELEPETVADLGADLVVGNDDKDRLPDLLIEHGLLPCDAPIERVGHARGVPVGIRTRAFLKVQDGCDNRCAYCIVTTARGRGRSRPAPDVVREILELSDQGFIEVVLSGVHLGSYGHDLGRRRGLEELVRTVLAETPVPRLRLSSIEPWDIEDGFFSLFEDPRLLPHLHLPMQSGCDATLVRMARRSTVAEIRSLISAARRAVPDLAVSTDVMVGFPGETDTEFETSLATVEELAFSRLHVFRFSRRAGTPAASFPDQVPGSVAAERSATMHALGAGLTHRFNSDFVGRCLPVLWETARARGSCRRWSGLTGNYIRVLADAPAGTDLANRVTEAVLETCLPGAVLASVSGQPLAPPSDLAVTSLPVMP
jgi:threonylcarbamoyladenosine tRNA methylthiotransferase MtaB